MPACPRCNHPAEQALAVCTQCGCAIPAESAGSFSLPRGLLWILVGVLLGVLFVLVFVYMEWVGQLGK